VISEKLKRVILTKLKLNEFDIKDETKAGQLPGWDSLTHVSVIVEIEKAFNVRFKMQEVLRLKNIGELQRLIDDKTSPQRGNGNG
jgi:acyl carrier protein